MRILVCPTDLVLGGASLNALELAGAVQGLGHDVVLAAPPGALRARVAEANVEYIALPSLPNHPDRAAAAAVSRLVRRFRPDVVHTYEFGALLAGFYGPGWSGVPQLATVMSMWLPGWLPRTVPLTVGTRALLDELSTPRHAPAHLLEPPVDLASISPGTQLDATGFREQHGIGGTAGLVAVVSRLDREMKLEGIQDLLLAADRLADDGITLVVVGGGSGGPEVASLARSINDRHRRPVVVLTGPLSDPGPAYVAADVVVGMGSSIIKGLSYGKPTIVVGIDGFVLPVSPATWSHFDRQGFWGVGGGNRVHELEVALRDLLGDSAERARLGAWGAATARERFSLEAGARRLEELYEATSSLRTSPGQRLADRVRTLGYFAPKPVRQALKAGRRALRSASSGSR